ncbi:MAG: TetR/AcrR family transcriptional regulator [Ktedonobacterales bacterium]
MPRRSDPNRREHLENAVVDYVLAHGIADLSLRPVAEALGVSTFSLVYHFGSKEGLIAAVMARTEERQRDMTAAWLHEDEASATLAAIMRRYWDEWCLPDELAPYHRLFYEVYALSLQQPERFPAFLEGGASPWLPFIRDLARRCGASEPQAELAASLMVSTVLGALLVLLGNHDKDLATRTVYAAADYVEQLTASWRPITSLSANGLENVGKD